MSVPRVALLLDTSGTWERQVIAGVGDYTREHGRWALHLSTGGPVPPVDGFIGDGTLKSASPQAPPAGCPWVEVSHSVTPQHAAVAEGKACRVTGDPVAVGRLAAGVLLRTGARHFVDLVPFGADGHQRPDPFGDTDAFGHSGPPGHSDSLGAAFAAELRANGQNATVARVDRAEVGSGGRASAGLASFWLAGLSRPVAVFTRTPTDAFHLLQSLPPADDLAATDVWVLAARYDELLDLVRHRPWAAIDQNPRKIGYDAAARLDPMLRGGSAGGDVLVAPSGVVNEGTFPAAASADPVIRRAVQLLGAQLAGPFSVPELAHAVGVSRRTLELRFRDVLGRSPARELRRLRVEQACRLLQSTDRPVAEVAAQCGFSAVELLQRAMQKQLGQTPTEFRSARAGSRSTR